MLLALLARDSEPLHHYEPGFWVDGEHWWARNQHRNPMPYGLYVQAKAQAYETLQAKRAAERAKHEAVRAERLRERQRLAEEQQPAFAAQEAERERFRQQAYTLQRQEWIDLLESTAAKLLGTSYYTHIVPGLERDLETIRSQPPGPLPWRLDRAVFNASLQRQMQERDRMFDGQHIDNNREARMIARTRKERL